MLIDKQTDFDYNDLTFDEIDVGFTTKEAIAEAKRCLNCAKPFCRAGCPIENEIPAFIQALAKGNVGEASAIIARRNNLPAVCGRVCAQEKQCEGACILARKGAAIKIGKLERFVADFDAEMEISGLEKVDKKQGKIAVIGSGPAGLTVASDMARLGFSVTVFEAQSEPGGILMYGIPEFRLGKEVVRREINRVKQYNVEFKTNVLVGPDLTVDQLFAEGYDAIFIGTGTALPKTLYIPGNNLPGVLQATYFLGIVQLANNGNVSQREIPVDPGDKVIVIGAGNVAMDAARTALRVGAERVTVIYQRTENDITALRSEFEEARNEGVQFQWLADTTAFLGEQKVEGLEFNEMEIDEENELIATGKKEILPADKIILAIGQRPAARIVSTTQGIQVSLHGFVITKDRPYGMTTRRGVFAGGDVVHQPATVVLAMKEAKKVAAGITQYVEAKKLIEDCGVELK